MAAPNNRFAYDRDGSATVILWGVIPYEATGNYTAADLALLNSDKNASGAVGVAYGVGDPCWGTICVVFPEARNVTHVYVGDSMTSGFLLSSSTEPGQIKYSTNTTDGVNGTWTTSVNEVYNRALPLFPGARDGISQVSWNNVKGIRWSRYSYSLFAGVRYHAMHIYGDRPTNISRLALWHPTLDQEADATTLDFGVTNRGKVYTKQFRVKNLSSTLTANTIGLSANANGDYSPTFVSQMSFNPSSITSLAAGEISSVCTLTYTVSALASLTTASLRLIAEAASWT